MSTPKHPAVVHFSVTTTLLTGALDAAHFLFHYGPTSAAVGSIYKTLDIQLNPDLFPLFSYYTTILTIIFAVPAVMTGAAELMPLIKRDGLGSPKAKVGIAHAMINDVTVLAAVFNWWTRRSVPMFIPSTTNILVSSLLALPATMFAAHLGGSLVYNYGMGLRIGQTAKSKKGQ